MSDKKTFRQWGYSKNDSKIFELKEGEALPKGYYDSPANIPAKAPTKKPAKKEPNEEAGDAE